MYFNGEVCFCCSFFYSTNNAASTILPNAMDQCEQFHRMFTRGLFFLLLFFFYAKAEEKWISMKQLGFWPTSLTTVNLKSDWAWCPSVKEPTVLRLGHFHTALQKNHFAVSDVFPVRFCCVFWLPAALKNGLQKCQTWYICDAFLLSFVAFSIHFIGEVCFLKPHQGCSTFQNALHP